MISDILRSDCVRAISGEWIDLDSELEVQFFQLMTIVDHPHTQNSRRHAIKFGKETFHEDVYAARVLLHEELLLYTASLEHTTEYLGDWWRYYHIVQNNRNLFNKN